MRVRFAVRVRVRVRTQTSELRSKARLVFWVGCGFGHKKRSCRGVRVVGDIRFSSVDMGSVETSKSSSV